MDNMDNNDELSKLTASYANELQTYYHEIESLWNKLKENDDDLIFLEFHRKIHNLSGTAGAFGFEKTSQVANEIQILLGLPNNRNHLTLDLKNKISPLLQKLINSGSSP